MSVYLFVDLGDWFFCLFFRLFSLLFVVVVVAAAAAVGGGGGDGGGGVCVRACLRACVRVCVFVFLFVLTDEDLFHIHYQLRATTSLKVSDILHPFPCSSLA